MLAVVASVGSVLLLQGMAGLNTFNAFLAIFGEEKRESFEEFLIIEHVKFDPESTAVSVWIRNTGISSVTIDKISMLKIDTQELIINDGDITDEVFQKDIMKIDPTVLPLPCVTPTNWQCTHTTTGALELSEYRITATTSRGNSFDTVVRPFNT